jgi:hypothetical protein
VDESFAQELEAIDWFAACGQSMVASFPFMVATVKSWEEAIELCSDQQWENVTLDACNELTVFLHTYHRENYLDWNVITDAAKQRVVTPLKERIWGPFAEQHGLGKGLLACVSWDVLAAIMEHEYRHCPGKPEFFTHLLQVYRLGHFPCGWSGDWPSGQLFVW